MVFQFLTSIALGINYTIASEYGDYVVAAMGIVSRIIALGTMIIFGFLKGVQAFIGYNYGAGKIERVKKSKENLRIKKSPI